jgi:hypothetical protein
MAFKINQVVVSETTENIKPTPAFNPNQLSVQELAFLLSTIKQVTLTGEQVEFMYNLIMKLQNQYIAQGL